MTVATTGSGGVIVPVEDDDNLGFEDIEAGDLVIPRITIDHKEAVFVDSLSKTTYESMNVIMLGVVKQRIMWAKETEDGDGPLCKSTDHGSGFPTLSDDVPKAKRFPWATSGLDPANFPPEAGVNGMVTLPCASCFHKEWNNPLLAGQNKPLCDEQYTFPVIYQVDDETWTTALFSVQRTGIKPAKSYISSFARSKSPMFRKITRLGLSQLSRGSVAYCVPTFAQLGESDRNQWADMATQYRQLREFVQMPPVNRDDDTVGTPSANVNTAAPTVSSPATAPATAPATPTHVTPSRPVSTPVAAPAATPAPAPAAPAPVGSEDDDLPF